MPSQACKTCQGEGTISFRRKDEALKRIVPCPICSSGIPDRVSKHAVWVNTRDPVTGTPVRVLTSYGAFLFFVVTILGLAALLIAAKLF